MTVRLAPVVHESDPAKRVENVRGKSAVQVVAAARGVEVETASEPRA